MTQSWLARLDRGKQSIDLHREQDLTHFPIGAAEAPNFAATTTDPEGRKPQLPQKQNVHTPLYHLL